MVLAKTQQAARISAGELHGASTPLRPEPLATRPLTVVDFFSMQGLTERQQPPVSMRILQCFSMMTQLQHRVACA
jgi:hypothetical protein